MNELRPRALHVEVALYLALVELMRAEGYEPRWLVERGAQHLAAETPKSSRGGKDVLE